LTVPDITDFKITRLPGRPPVLEWTKPVPTGNNNLVEVYDLLVKEASTKDFPSKSIEQILPKHPDSNTAEKESFVLSNYHFMKNKSWVFKLKTYTSQDDSSFSNLATITIADFYESITDLKASKKLNGDLQFTFTKPFSNQFPSSKVKRYKVHWKLKHSPEWSENDFYWQKPDEDPLADPFTEMFWWGGPTLSDLPMNFMIEPEIEGQQNSLNSNVIEATPDNETKYPPQPPTNLTLTQSADGKKITLNLKAPDNNGGSPIMGYGYMRRNIGKNEGWKEIVSNTNSTKTTHDDYVLPTDILEYRAFAINKIGRSGDSNTVQNKPLAPKITDLVITTTQDNLPVLDFTKPLVTDDKNGNHDYINRYRIQIKKHSAPHFTDPPVDTFPPKTPDSYIQETETYIMKNYKNYMKDGETYDLKILAYKSFPPYIESNIVTITAHYTPVTVPDTPTNLSATVEDSKTKVSWTAPKNNGDSIVTHYIAEIKQSVADKWTSSIVQGSPTSITDLINNTQYDIRVAAVNKVGTGPFSSIIHVTPKGKIPPPPKGKEQMVAQYFGITVKDEAGIQPEQVIIDNYDPTQYVGDPIFGVIGNTSHGAGTRYLEFVVVRRKKSPKE